jgi:hypothetical protein
MTSAIPVPIQTLYAELSERAHLARMADDFGPAGQFIQRTHQGRNYWYYRFLDQNSVRKDRYVGRDTPELADRIARFRDEKSDYKERRGIVAALKRVGLRGPDPLTGRVLEALAEAGVFRMRAVVVGTTAYQTYPGLLGVRLPLTDATTNDLDLAQSQGVSVAIDDELDSPLLDILHRVDERFEPLPAPFAKGRASRFVLGNRYRVDILTPLQGPNDETLVALPALKADAQPLRFLDFLIYREVQSVILWGAGVPVNVPSPERFALHKLLVSRLRLETKDAQAKAGKDIRQASELLRVLNEQRPYELKDLWNELTNRGDRWRTLVTEAISLIDPVLRESLHRAIA